MPSFAYDAVDVNGRRQSGRSSAESAGALSRSLEERGLFVLRVAEEAPGAGTSWWRPGRKREVLEFTRAMAALLPVGMPLARALGAATGVATADVAEAILDVKARVERGVPLADALAEHRALFDPLYVGIVRAGERSGDLDAAFGRLAEQIERAEQLQARIVSAAIYPLLLASAGTIAVCVLIFFVLPRFVTLLEGAGATLPATTRALLAVTGVLQRAWPVFVLVPFVIAALAAWVRNTAEGRRAWASFLLALPMVRTLRQYAISARFARLLGVLLAGGAPLLPALDDTMESIGDPIARDEIARVRGKVREGSSMRQAVGESTLFTPLLAQLIGVGEEAGDLRTFLVKSADIFEERTERATQRLSAIAEPAMIVVFGAIVAFVALSLLQAIYGINAGSFR
ncbi:MAG TPA: type II secretion system F family protein [Gemmatimonadaceae bacterium]|nr:type II secretion system F family protein [Gemmatimonadaceae bacterium]